MSQLSNNLWRQSSRLMPQMGKRVIGGSFSTSSTTMQQQELQKQEKVKSTRFIEFQKKLRATAPFSTFDELSRHPFQEVEALRPWPNSTNPHTGEIGGPSGPEPTRYGDWERKGRVSDF